MSKWAKFFSTAAFSAVLTLPFSAFANSDQQELVERETYKLVATSEAEGNTMTIHATIEGATTAEQGKWSIEPTENHPEWKVHHEQTVSGVDYTHTYTDVEPGEYCFKVHYHGKINGESADTALSAETCVTVGEEEKQSEQPKEDNPKPEQPEPPKPESPTPEPPKQEEPAPCKPLEDLVEVDFRDIQVKTVEKGNFLVVTAKLDVKHAEGKWYLAAGPANGSGKPIVQSEQKLSGNTFTYTFHKSKLPQGEILIAVVFEGRFDDQSCQYGVGYDQFMFSDHGHIAPLPQDGDGDGSPDSDQPAQPDDAQQVIDHVKGGQLPKTATPHGTMMLFGTALMLAGAGILLTRRLAA